MKSTDKYKIVEKAYQVNFDKVEEGFLASVVWCHANTHNEAKKKLLKEIIVDDWKLKYSDEPLSYLTIPIKRCVELDLVEFRGEVIHRNKIKGILEEEERNEYLESILNDKSISHCYIKKDGYYYKPNSAGYTEYVSKAGVYSKEDAISHVRYCNELSAIPIDITTHNDTINQEIKVLQSNLI